MLGGLGPKEIAMHYTVWKELKIARRTLERYLELEQIWWRLDSSWRGDGIP
jgi:hypothetical protein